MMVARKNPYLDLPLPANVRIDFDLFARNGAQDGPTLHHTRTTETIALVVRALNHLAYGQVSTAKQTTASV